MPISFPCCKSQSCSNKEESKTENPLYDHHVSFELSLLFSKNMFLNVCEEFLSAMLTINARTYSVSLFHWICQKRPVRPFQSIIGVTPDEWQETFRVLFIRAAVSPPTMPGIYTWASTVQDLRAAEVVFIPNVSSLNVFWATSFKLSRWPGLGSSKNGWNSPLDKSLNHVNWDRDSHR